MRSGQHQVVFTVGVHAVVLKRYGLPVAHRNRLETAHEIVVFGNDVPVFTAPAQFVVTKVGLRSVEEVVTQQPDASNPASARKHNIVGTWSLTSPGSDRAIIKGHISFENDVSYKRLV